MDEVCDKEPINAVRKEMLAELVPGQVDIRLFRLLSSICVMHSSNIRQSLEDVLVHGKTRREACEANGVTQSYFSVKYRHVQMVSHTVVRIYELLSE
ncbi:transcriptional regulator [Hafnia paralvei]|jgi:hypothetical protein|uniref:PapB/FocB family fimbrial expression transcriptional regulator n=1 Tax=Hafnia paralvei TaxID=546367 RepID=UPI00103404C2|nr:PapB/FocB family fimbrial expression transcriptional regulator [Hafnia paralvei]MDX6840842.1 PapB/FocB family fimbrial expression transcriptional regulator [Hafnia paralvei]TBM01120.1 transcriptional regulator [Hafnia paralvei]TBM21895.1 transcriptional regulator [Hafnia paralvei]